MCGFVIGVLVAILKTVGMEQGFIYVVANHDVVKVCLRTEAD